MDPRPELPITALADRHPGLTQAIAENYLEAARVCLDRHHTSPTTFGIDHPGDKIEPTVNWEPTDTQTRAAWANDDDATEMGAYACLLAGAELSQGFVAIRRAETRTGADYYLGVPGVEFEDLEDAIRFEISGVDRGSQATLRRRLKDKLEQASKGASSLPAVAGVVGFAERLILIAPLNES